MENLKLTKNSQSVSLKERILVYVPSMALFWVVAEVAKRADLEKMGAALPLVIAGVYIAGRIADMWSTKMVLDAGGREASPLAGPRGEGLWTWQRLGLEGIMLWGALKYHPFGVGMAFISALAGINNLWVTSQMKTEGV